MENQVVISPFQQVTNADYNNFSANPTKSLDTLARDAITDGKAYVGFSVLQSGQTEVTVAAGRYWKNGQRFYNADEGGVPIDLLSLLPAVTRKIVSIVVWGNEIVTDVASRGYKNVETGQTYSDSVGRERRRVASVDRVPGQENVDPQPPAVDANVLTIAHVLLDPTGIVSITMVEANRLVSLKTLNTRLTLVERRLEQAGSQIETLRTDVAGLAGRLAEKANLKMTVQMAIDLARVMREARLPNDYIAWDSDDFRDALKSDPAHAGYAAYVMNGLRFDGAEGLSALALLNNIDDRIVVADDMVRAKSHLVRRLSVVGKDGEIALATYQTKETQMVKQVEARKVYQMTNIGDAGADLLRGSGWQAAAEYSEGPYSDGSYFPGTAVGVNARSYIRGYIRRNPVTGEQEILQFQHVENLDFRTGKSIVNEFWLYGVVKTVEDVTWISTLVNLTVNGYQAALTFLNSQSGSIGGANLFFTRKGASGDVKLLLVECAANGTPDPRQVVAESTLAAADIVADPAGLTPTFFAFPAKQLVKGKRYALHVVTQGSHWLATISGDKFAQGAAFVLQNDTWNQLGAEIDIPFELFFHQYEQTRIEVPLVPVMLAGGIGYIDINFDVVEPEGTSIQLEGKTNGGWFPIPFRSDMTNPLLALPETLQIRAVMLGTIDDMPKFGIGPARSCATARRESALLNHFSEVLTAETAGDTVEVRLKGYGFDPLKHTLTAKIYRGADLATVETVDVVSDAPTSFVAPGTFHKSLLFNLGATADEYVLKIEGATSVPGDTFVITERTSVLYET